MPRDQQHKYVQPGAGAPNWRHSRRHDELLWDGGLLFAMVVDAVSPRDMRGGLDNGPTFSVSWQPVTDPEAVGGRAFDSAPDAAIFSRGEGCWEGKGRFYIVSTDGGAASLGQVWLYNPDREQLTLLYESRDPNDVDGPDNIAVSPRGGIVLCEDGGFDPKRLIGMTQDGVTFPFADNLIDLKSGDIDTIDAVFPGTQANFWDDPVGRYTSRAWCGATFYKEWLFVNIQSPGVTFAIRGPRMNGAL